MPFRAGPGTGRREDVRTRVVNLLAERLVGRRGDLRVIRAALLPSGSLAGAQRIVVQGTLHSAEQKVPRQVVRFTARPRGYAGSTSRDLMVWAL